MKMSLVVCPSLFFRRNMCPNLIPQLFILFTRENQELHHPVNCLGQTVSGQHTQIQSVDVYMSFGAQLDFLKVLYKPNANAKRPSINPHVWVSPQSFLMCQEKSH